MGERRESADHEPVEVLPEPSTDLPEGYSEDTLAVEEDHANPTEESTEEDLMLRERMNYRNSVVSNFSMEMQQFEALDFRLDNRSTIIKARDSSSLDLLEAALDRGLEHLTELEESGAGDRGTIIYLNPIDKKKQEDEDEDEEGARTPTQQDTPKTSVHSALQTPIEEIQRRAVELERSMAQEVEDNLRKALQEEQEKSKKLEELVTQLRHRIQTLEGSLQEERNKNQELAKKPVVHDKTPTPSPNAGQKSRPPELVQPAYQRSKSANKLSPVEKPASKLPEGEFGRLKQGWSQKQAPTSPVEGEGLKRSQSVSYRIATTKEHSPSPPAGGFSLPMNNLMNPKSPNTESPEETFPLPRDLLSKFGPYKTFRRSLTMTEEDQLLEVD